MSLGVGSLIEISTRGVYLTQQVMNVYTYRINNVGGAVTASNIGEAWWNHVKTTLRNIPTTAASTMFQSVSVREMDSATGDYGEYAVPSGERAGTRSTGSEPSPLPVYCSAGVRLVVASRTTRPGQKRFAGLTETDNDTGQLQTTLLAALNAFFAVYVPENTLGAPAALTTLKSVVVRKGADGIPTAHQEVVGYVINPYMTSQVSRKVGRGS